jgi:hypothetical protein
VGENLSAVMVVLVMVTAYPNTPVSRAQVSRSPLLVWKCN